MIDLYAVIGLPGPVPAHRIEEALSNPSLRAETRDLVAFVLKDPHRRATYDAAWRMHQLSAAVRLENGLTETVLWKRTPPLQSPGATAGPMSRVELLVFKGG